ncbi:MAG TPA: hypothetical protein VFX38_03580, partial [Gammaproteobacteria bacterium]|nr:hypothetical protein [Gammaproteobacteria bacterium]
GGGSDKSAVCATNTGATMRLDEAILSLVKERSISDQKELLLRLEEAGVAATQPTLSRHMKKLGVRKLAGRYQRIELSGTPIPPFSLTPVPPGLLVLRTRPGYAQAVAIWLDQKNLASLVGTIAGDDTVFIAVRNPPPLETVAETLSRLLRENAPG